MVVATQSVGKSVGTRDSGRNGMLGILRGAAGNGGGEQLL